MSELESDRESIISEASENDKRTPVGKKAGRPSKAKAGEGVKTSKKGGGTPVDAPPGSRIKPRSYSAEEGWLIVKWHLFPQNRESK